VLSIKIVKKSSIALQETLPKAGRKASCVSCIINVIHLSKEARKRTNKPKETQNAR